MMVPSAADTSLIRDTVSGDKKHKRHDRELASPTSSVAFPLPTSLYGKFEAIQHSLGSKGEGSKVKGGKSKGGKGGKSKGGKGKGKGTLVQTPTDSASDEAPHQGSHASSDVVTHASPDPASDAATHALTNPFVR